MKKILFIDRDGTLINEPKDFQVDSFEKLSFKKSVLKYLSKISEELDFDLVMVTNQDGLGTKSFPEKEFWPVQNFIIKTLQNEGIYFKEILIDRTFPDENANTRKPNTGLIEKYLVDKNININESFVIGDRLTDLKFAQNIGCKGILINDLKTTDYLKSGSNIDEDSMFSFQDWKSIYKFLKLEFRTISFTRKTNETKIKISLNLDGTGNSSIDTGIKFFDLMLLPKLFGFLPGHLEFFLGILTNKRATKHLLYKVDTSTLGEVHLAKTIPSKTYLRLLLGSIVQDTMIDREREQFSKHINRMHVHE